ncbi:hypothetical protein BASA83_000567 [Batrachochytrium salamandrivorans]|nr:hypothetical protein BASA83_000567 [Batrachochytrium salamandrivorans]
MLSSIDPYHQNRQSQRYRQQYFQDAPSSSTLPGLGSLKAAQSISAHSYNHTVVSASSTASQGYLYNDRHFHHTTHQHMHAPSSTSCFEAPDVETYSHHLHHQNNLYNQQLIQPQVSHYYSQPQHQIHSQSHYSQQPLQQRHQQQTLYNSIYSVSAPLPPPTNIMLSHESSLNSLAKRVVAHLPKLKAHLPPPTSQPSSQQQLQQLQQSLPHTQQPQPQDQLQEHQHQHQLINAAYNSSSISTIPTPNSEYADSPDVHYTAINAFEDFVTSNDPDEYGFEIYTYMQSMEESTMPQQTLMNEQKEITWKMRRTLLLWLIEVHSEYDLRQETLYLTVNIIDRMCEKCPISRSQYQLLGITSLWIASKYEENHGKVPLLKNLSFICCNSYRESEFLQMERFILHKMGFGFGVPTHEFFLKAHCALYMKHQISPEARVLARYILELTLVHRRFVGSRPSSLALASIFLSDEILGHRHWYHEDQRLRACMDQLVECLIDPPETTDLHGLLTPPKDALLHPRGLGDALASLNLDSHGDRSVLSEKETDSARGSTSMCSRVDPPLPPLPNDTHSVVALGTSQSRHQTEQSERGLDSGLSCASTAISIPPLPVACSLLLSLSCPAYVTGHAPPSLYTATGITTVPAEGLAETLAVAAAEIEATRVLAKSTPACPTDESHMLWNGSSGTLTDPEYALQESTTFQSDSTLNANISRIWAV